MSLGPIVATPVLVEVMVISGFGLSEGEGVHVGALIFLQPS